MKFRQYLLYALGEIVLVVIGILIALQINNQRNQRKMEAKELAYLKDIRENLLHDDESGMFDSSIVLIASELMTSKTRKLSFRSLSSEGRFINRDKNSI